jgi:mannose-6-phosphate isomerase-like protein (cupin superfamily)
MKLSSLLSIALLAAVTQASRTQLPVLPEGVTIWPQGRPPHGIKQKDDYGNHILSVSHREKSGVVELHETKEDVMVVQSGAATLIVGGRGTNMHPSAPKEQQGTNIEGGVSIHVSAGDVIHIPANIAHQFLLEPGKQITYTLVKIVNR